MGLMLEDDACTMAGPGSEVCSMDKLAEPTAAATSLVEFSKGGGATTTAAVVSSSGRRLHACHESSRQASITESQLEASIFNLI